MPNSTQSHRLLPSTVCALLASLAVADGADSSPSASTAHTPPLAAASVLRAPVDRVFFDEPGDGRIWACGATFKMSFGREGATYIPFLGADAPRNYPVRFELASVSHGARALEFAAEISATRDGDSVSFDRGSVVESYHLAPESVEQTFTLRALPARGELDVVLRVATDLAPRSDASSLRFENELGYVSYGRATAIDAEGERWSLPTRLDGADIRITVPQACAERCRLPLVVDPILATSTFGDATDEYSQPDVAFDPITSQWMIVFALRRSEVDRDVYSLVMDHAAAGQAYGMWINIDAEDWSQPQVAYSAAARRFLIATDVRAAGMEWIGARTRATDVEDFPPPPFRVTEPVTGLARECDVGGDEDASGPTRWLVAWSQQESGVGTRVRARVVHGADSMSPPVDVTPSDLQERTPAVVKRGRGGSWLVTRRQLAQLDPPTEKVWARPVRDDAQDPLGTDVPVDPQGPGVALFRCEVSPTTPHGDALVLFARSVIGGGVHLFGTLFHDDAIVAAEIDVTNLLGAGGGQTRHAAVDSVGDAFVVTFADPDSATLRVATLHRSGEGLVASSSSLAWCGSTAPTARVAVASASLGSPPHAFLVGESAGDVAVASYLAPTAGPVRIVCTGDGTEGACPCWNYGASGHGCSNSFHANGALLTTTGRPSVSHDDLALQVLELPPTTTCLLAQGTAVLAPGEPIGDGQRCLSGSALRLGLQSTNGGGLATFGADVPLSVQGSVPASGGLRYYQVWYRNTADYCTGATFNLTNAIEVNWTP